LVIDADTSGATGDVLSLDAALQSLSTGVPDIAIQADPSDALSGIGSVESELSGLAGDAPAILLTSDPSDALSGIGSVETELAGMSDAPAILLTADTSDAISGIASVDTELSGLSGAPEILLTANAGDALAGISSVDAELAGLSQAPEIVLTANAGDALSGISSVDAELAGLFDAPEILLTSNPSDALSGISSVESELSGLAGDAPAILITADPSDALSGLSSVESAAAGLTGDNVSVLVTADVGDALSGITSVDSAVAGISDESVSVLVTADTSDAMAGLADIEARIANLEGQASSAGGGIDALGGSFAGMGDKAKLAGGILAGGFVAAAVGAVMSASDMNENLNKMNVVFGDSADAVAEFASTSAQSFGISESAALGTIGTFGNLLVSMGLGTNAAADMSTGVLSLAADLGSFNNIGTEEVLEKIRAGLVGETEPLRALGVNLSAAAVEARVLADNIGLTKDQITPAMKATASYALILEQTKTSQGDFANTSTGMANSMKIIQASFADVAAEIGSRLLPSIAPLISSLATSLPGAIDVVSGALDKMGAAFDLISPALVIFEPLLGSIAAIISGVLVGAMVRWAVVTYAQAAAWLVLNAAMLPQIAALAAVGAAVYLLIKYWDPLIEKFPIIQRAVDEVKVSFQNFAAFVQGMAGGIATVLGGLIGIWKSYFDTVIAIVTGAGSVIKELLSGNFEGAKEAAVNAVSGVAAAFSGFETAAKTVINGAQSAWTGGMNAISASSASAATAVEGFIGPILAVGPGMVGFIGPVLDAGVALGKQAEMAGLANERNSDYFLGVQLGSGAVAEAAFALDKLSEASTYQIAAMDSLGAAQQSANANMQVWEGRLTGAEGALKLLDGELAEHGSLTSEQQAKYDILTGAVGRYQGGIEDSEGAVIDSAVAMAQLTSVQDDLNGKLAAGVISEADYARAMGDALSVIDPAAAATFGLAGAQAELTTAIDATVNKLGNLLIDLGILPESKRVDFQTPGLPEADAAVGAVTQKLNDVPATTTATMAVDDQASGPIEAVHMLGEGYAALNPSTTLGAVDNASDPINAVHMLGEGYAALNPITTLAIVDNASVPINGVHALGEGYAALNPSTTLTAVDGASGTINGVHALGEGYAALNPSTTLSAVDNASGAIDGVTSAANNVPKSITIYADVDTSGFYSALEGMAAAT
ncbi:MAG: hypothetical protein M3440_15345, partial [Chloroflexota bacterium]|nr:hypothetical protein [Chloroflexota bacterium]